MIILVISNVSLRLCVGEKMIRFIPNVVSLHNHPLMSSAFFIFHVNKHGIVFIPGCLLLKNTEIIKISLLPNIYFPEF